MDAGVEIPSPQFESTAGTVLNIPANDDNAECLTPKLPRRLRCRLQESKTPTISAQDIEAKLYNAHLRRQKFYESLSSKARSKVRSGFSTSQENYLGLQLKAKHHAAEQKRLGILAQIQNRLARLDQMRKNARNGVQMRFLKERDELSTKVESRVQQARINRMRLLNAYRQQQVAKREKASQSLKSRVIQEKKYKECIRAAIHQKRTAAERKRIGFLEAQQCKARLSTLQAQQVTCFVNSKVETEKKILHKRLKSLPKKVQSIRAENLRKKGRVHNLGRSSSGMVKQKMLIKKLIRCWRLFARLKGTTFSLAKAYEELQINQKSVKSMPFETLAVLLESGDTIRIVKSLLHRLETYIIIRRERNGKNGVLHVENIDHLLERVAVPGKKVDASKAFSRIKSEKTRSLKDVAQKSAKLCRYPTHFVLGSYIVSSHPDVVSWGTGDSGIDLVKAAEIFSQEFELLVKIMLQRPVHSSEESRVSTASQLTFSSQLEKFDKAWCSYLYHFVTWKEKDAKLLEDDIVRAAFQHEVTRMHNYKRTLEGDCAEVTHMETLLDQMKTQCMSGNDGPEHMGGVLSNTFSTTSPDQLPSSSSPGPSTVWSSNNFSEFDSVAKSKHNMGRVVMLKQEERNMHNEIASPSSESKTDDHQISGQMLVTENTVIVNELVHGHYSRSADSLIATNEDQGSIKSMVEDTMEKAFWDGVIETFKQDKPDYTWVLKLIKEIRDELCQLSPSSWRQEIDQTIDLDILSQVLRMGTLDIEHCGRILEFSLVTLQKLSAPAKEDELKTAHQNLLRELAEISQVGEISVGSFALIVMRGLRFILKQIQTLKQEVTKARITMLEPLIKGPMGFEYLRSSFANLYGSPSDALTRLPLVRQWFSAVLIESEKNWGEYLDSLSVINSTGGESSKQYSPIILRAGCTERRVSTTSATSSVAGVEQPECKGDKVDLLLRLGLLKLVSEVEGLTAIRLPETIQLNLLRLRSIQSQLQKIIVISTSLLILRQMLISEHLVTSPLETENVISDCVKRLSQLLDSVEDVGVSEIVEVMNCYMNIGEDTEKSRVRKDVMSNMLGKSLSSGDAVFSRVSCSVYLAARGIVLGGTGAQGKHLAETALMRIGAAPLVQRLVDALGSLVVMANVSRSVHGAWYEQVLRNI